MLCAFYHPYIGGAEIFSKEIAERLVNDGHRVTVITGRWDKKDKLLEEINKVRVIRVGPVLNTKNLRLISYILPAVIAGSKLKDVNVYHSNLAFSAGFAGALIKKFTGKPLIITAQGGDLGDYKENTGKFGGILTPFISWGIKQADIVHGISNHTSRLSKKLGAKKIVTIPLGYNEEKFNPHISPTLVIKRYGIRGEPVIISASRLSEKNGISYIIKAMPSILEEFPDTQLYVAGDGEEKENLKRQILEAGLSQNVHLLGSVPHKDIAAFIRSGDVFIRPSLDEGLGVAFIESIACGVPTIGTNVGGIPDIIKDRETGLLIPPSDSKAISDSILRVQKDKKLRQKLIKTGLDYVTHNFKWKSIYNQICNVYEKLI